MGGTVQEALCGRGANGAGSMAEEAQADTDTVLTY